VKPNNPSGRPPAPFRAQMQVRVWKNGRYIRRGGFCLRLNSQREIDAVKSFVGKTVKEESPAQRERA